MRDIAAHTNFTAPTRLSVWQNAEFKQSHGYDFGYGAFTDAYANTLKVADKDYRPLFRDSRPMLDRVGIALQEAVVGTKTTQQALDDAQSDNVAMLKRGGYLK
jgi:multiple sugar transport system substrate-binding protein